jgi:hypothetical protein
MFAETTTAKWMLFDASKLALHFYPVLSSALARRSAQF